MSLPPELKALALILGIAFMAAAIVGVTASTPTPPSAVPPTALPTAAVARATPQPAVVAGPLTGLPTARALATRRPVAVVVDDFFPDARPQSGLADASVVFDALVESGITRLMPIYLERDAPQVGPIRSARSYFVTWAEGFRALFVHGGGAPAALELLRHTPQVGDLEALSSDAEFRRDANKAAPHDLFASTAGIHAVAQRKSLDTAVPFSFAPFKHGLPLAARGRKQAIRISFSTAAVASPPAYDVSYQYLRNRNVYRRSQGGNPFLDVATGRPITVVNVVALFVNVAPIANDSAQRVSMNAIGGGKAWFFRDGHTVRGTWRKDSAAAPLIFLDSHGQPLQLDAGNTWIEAVPTGGVQYSGS